MRLIIAGGRDYLLTQGDYAKLDTIHREHRVIQVVSGRAPGADTCGELWAKRNHIPVQPFPAKWRKPGPTDGAEVVDYEAGKARNTEMANYATALAAFPGGTGTADMLKKAHARDLKIFNYSGISIQGELGI